MELIADKKKLLIKCLNRITTHVERSGVYCASKMMGYPHEYKTDGFVSIYINSMLHHWPGDPALDAYAKSSTHTGDDDDTPATCSNTAKTPACGQSGQQEDNLASGMNTITHIHVMLLLFIFH